jgi:hypothetical protein
VNVNNQPIPNIRRSIVDEPSETTVYSELWKRNQPVDDDIKLSQADMLVGDARSRMDGYNIKDYNRKKRDGVLLPHTAFGRRYWSSSSTGTYQVTMNNGTIYSWSPVYTPFDYYLLTDSDLFSWQPVLDDYYVQAAAAKIWNQGHDTLTFVAELHRVRSMFKDAIKRLLRLEIPRNWRQLNNDYLATRYGWRILMFDIQNINEALTEFDAKRTRYSERQGNAWSFSTQDIYTHSYTHYDIDLTVNTNVSISVRGSVSADISPPQWKFNILDTAWELIPYSFVIDWFISVGSALAAINAVNSSTAYAASKGFKMEVERTMTSETYNLDKLGQTSSINVAQSGSSNATWLYRRPTGISISPQWTVRLNEWKVLDLIALALQRL